MSLLSRRGLVSAGLATLVAVAMVVGLKLAAFFVQDAPVARSEDPSEHFKYGSIGSEAALGIPRPIFEVLPALFEDLLPSGAGTGYARLGFTYEPGHPLPVGVSERLQPIPLVGLNCAACHAGTLRRSPGGPQEILPGAPANRFDSGAFLQFLVEVGADPRFEPDRLFAAMEAGGHPLSWPDRLLYRLVFIPRLRARLLELRQQLSAFQRRPASGPGRADAVALDQVLSHDEAAASEDPGTADYPPLYDRRLHSGRSLHFVVEDEAAAGRVVRWLQDLPPPVFPRERIDLGRAQRGRVTWEGQCADCHAIGGRLVGRLTSAVEVGTDAGLARLKKVDGYLNAPLDGLWARSPYLHNGSVPTLRALLFPEERPEVFFRGYDAFDWEQVGYVSSGPEAEKDGFRYDTRLRGNGRGGHTRYGASLSREEKEDLLEFLKTL